MVTVYTKEGELRLPIETYILLAKVAKKRGRDCHIVAEEFKQKTRTPAQFEAALKKELEN